MKIIGGIEYLSVTEIIAAAGLGPTYSRISAHVMDHAKARGQAVHQAIQYHLDGDLDEESLHPEVANGFRGWQRWAETAGFRPLAGWIERELTHPTWHFYGHPDAFGYIKDGGSLILADWKNNSYDELATGCQLAGYAMLWEAGGTGEKLRDRAYVVLIDTAAGTARQIPVQWRQYLQTFQAVLVVTRAQIERRTRNDH